MSNIKNWLLAYAPVLLFICYSWIRTSWDGGTELWGFDWLGLILAVALGCLGGLTHKRMKGYERGA